MLRFHELSPSPNSTKVRMALRYKQIEFESVPIDPRNREALVELSGQELSPVIEDRGIVLNDSEAILQYLDANYRDRPRLFPADRAGRHASDEWNKSLSARLVPHWLPIFFTAIGRQDSFDPSSRASFLDGLAWLETELSKGESLGPPIDELRVAQWTTYALPGPGLIARSPLFARSHDLFAASPTDYPNLTRFLTPWHPRLA